MSGHGRMSYRNHLLVCLTVCVHFQHFCRNRVTFELEISSGNCVVDDVETSFKINHWDVALDGWNMLFLSSSQQTFQHGDQ